MSSVEVSRLLVCTEHVPLLKVVGHGLLLLCSVLACLVLVLACNPAGLFLSGVL